MEVQHDSAWVKCIASWQQFRSGIICWRNESLALTPISVRYLPWQSEFIQRGEGSRARETEMLDLSVKSRQWLGVAEQMLEQLAAEEAGGELV